MKKEKKYWKSLEQLNGDPLVKKFTENEFLEEIPVDEFLSNKENLSNTKTNRRDFLKFLGFSTAAATLASCEAPIQKAIPYVVKPDEIVPGVANFYATTYFDGHDFASILVKTREGRPIKIEPNQSSVNARIQASVLSLYDSARLKSPIKQGNAVDWKIVDAEIISKLKAIKDKQGTIAILTPTIISPTTLQLIEEFSSEYGNVRHVMSDDISYHSMLEANKKCFNARYLPSYNFEKANVIVSFGADFLGNWLDEDYATQYISARNPKDGKMSKHYQLETNLSLTGSNADERIQIKPSDQAYLLSDLYQALLRNKSPEDGRIKKIASDLLKNKQKSLVISNSNNQDVQILVNAINKLLDNYENTLSIRRPSFLKKGNENSVSELIEDMNAKKIDALITYHVNPLYTSVKPKIFNSALKNVGLKVSISLYADETASKMDYLCPDNHNLESWGDANPRLGQYSLMQPTIAPLFNTRQFQESLMKWMDSPNNSDYYAYLKDFYSDVNWNKVLHDGYFEKRDLAVSVSDSDFNIPLFKQSNDNGIELELYEKISMGNGSQANNPWLQELPDPISRACWDNYLTISASTARELDLSNRNVSNGGLNGSVVDVIGEGVTLRNVPVMIQPGQAHGTIGLALGYGRTHAGKAGDNVGVNAYPLLKTSKVKLVKLDKEHEFAAIQLHHTMMGRDFVKETSLADYIKDPKSGNHRETFAYKNEQLTPDKLSLWKEHDHKTGHFWNLSIDLTKCIGCAACVISCHAENNVAVVGKEEMRKSRDMHWLRIDRYYSSEMTPEHAKKNKVSTIKMYKDMEEPSASPEVVFQPVMCQHCNHAPCETVCPVAATSHSAEGLNHMAYNRCVGTRYCANNCPYKVRRFNWFQYSENEKFDYHMNDDYGKMVLNPDVTVRSRGVMEKCSMCIQTIQQLKLQAKKEGRKIRDDEAKTACSSVCSTNAIEFGDANDKDSKVHSLKKDERAYYLLDHLNVAPSVFYQTKIRNKA